MKTRRSALVLFAVVLLAPAGIGRIVGAPAGADEGPDPVVAWNRAFLDGVRESTLILTVITIFGAFKVFDIVWVMTAGGPNHASEVLGTHMYRSAFRDDVAGYASAVATVIFLITLAIGAMQIKLQRDH